MVTCQFIDNTDGFDVMFADIKLTGLHIIGRARALSYGAVDNFKDISEIIQSAVRKGSGSLQSFRLQKWISAERFLAVEQPMPLYERIFSGNKIINPQTEFHLPGFAG